MVFGVCFIESMLSGHTIWRANMFEDCLPWVYHLSNPLYHSPCVSPTLITTSFTLVLSGYFFPLGESNPLKSSSSRLEIDERANYKSFLLDFTIELWSKWMETELTFSPSLHESWPAITNTNDKRSTRSRDSRLWNQIKHNYTFIHMKI